MPATIFRSAPEKGFDSFSYCVNVLNVIVSLVWFCVFSVRMNGFPGLYKNIYLSQVPVVQNQEVQRFEVEVQGDTFYSKEVRKVMIRVYQPMTFIQTDKPMYLPGQTGNFELIICCYIPLTDGFPLYKQLWVHGPENCHTH